ncbi:MAG: glutaminyl-peptide cyclotransferase [Bacteroidales bacterium]|nr:glutaminyl-peptide cyclotransferase [Bacteroidales bacterium]
MRLRRILLFCVIVLLPVSCGAKVRSYRPQVVASYPHDETSYTQGLFFHGGQMYESTGQYGESTMRRVDPATGKTLQRLDFDGKYFVEGSVILDGKLYILTWTNKLVFVYDAGTWTYEKTLGYPREGWGLTTDGEQLIASDGSSRLFFMDKDLRVQRTVTVRLDDRPVRYLNELEYIDGKIWANVYMSDVILVINPSDGRVEATVDCTGLLPRQYRDRRTDVLNGIAFNPSDGKIYLTGKYWKRLFEITLTELSR